MSTDVQQETQKPQLPVSILASLITDGEDISPRKILVYGQEGVGKSSLGKDAPSPVFMRTEEPRVKVPRLPKITSYGQAIEQLMYLLKEPHEFKTLVFDVFNGLESLAHVEVCENEKKKSIGDFFGSSGYEKGVALMRRCLNAFDLLRERRGMTILLLAHASVQPVRNPEGQNYDQFAPRMHALTRNLVQEWVDEEFFATFKTYTTNYDAGFNRTKTVGTGGTDRVMMTRKKPAWEGKCRIDAIPDELPLSWAEYAKYLPSA